MSKLPIQVKSEFVQKLLTLFAENNVSVAYNSFGITAFIINGMRINAQEIIDNM